MGARKQLPLKPVRILRDGRLVWFTPHGAPTPGLVSPKGAMLVDRFVVQSWIIGRFVLARPQRLSVRRLLALAPQYFHRTPKAMLVFFQQPDQ